MQEQNIETKARIYLYDLTNCAKEHGFKAEESWELSLATTVEKAALEKKYYPVISKKVLPEILSELFHSVKEKLKSTNPGMDRRIQTNAVFSSDQNYLMAFNPNRLR